jgi:hypothetical protein
MTVYKRPNGRWAVQTYDPATTRSRQIGTYNTRKEAKQAEADAIGRHTAGGSETIQSFTARWTHDYPRPKPSTNIHNTERVQRFATEHARRRLDSITIEEARAWTLKRPGDLSALRAMFSDARRDGKLTTNPFTGLGTTRQHRRRNVKPDWLTQADITRLATVARDTHGEYGPAMAAMVTFAAYTGIRPGELFALEPADLDGTSLHIRRAANSRTRTITTPKNGQPRTIVLPRDARTAVEPPPNTPANAPYSSPPAADNSGRHTSPGYGTPSAPRSAGPAWRSTNSGTSAPRTSSTSAYRQATSPTSSGIPTTASSSCRRTATHPNGPPAHGSSPPSTATTPVTWPTCDAGEERRHESKRGPSAAHSRRGARQGWVARADRVHRLPRPQRNKERGRARHPHRQGALSRFPASARQTDPQGPLRHHLSARTADPQRARRHQRLSMRMPKWRRRASDGTVAYLGRGGTVPRRRRPAGGSRAPHGRVMGAPRRLS